MEPFSRSWVSNPDFGFRQSLEQFKMSRRVVPRQGFDADRPPDPVVFLVSRDFGKRGRRDYFSDE